MIYELSQIRDWAHFLPPKLMCTEFCLWKIWLFVYIITRPASLGPAPMATKNLVVKIKDQPNFLNNQCYFLSKIFDFAKISAIISFVFIIFWFSARFSGFSSTQRGSKREAEMMISVLRLLENLELRITKNNKRESKHFDEDEINAKIKCNTKNSN